MLGLSSATSIELQKLVMYACAKSLYKIRLFENTAGDAQLERSPKKATTRGSLLRLHCAQLHTQKKTETSPEHGRGEKDSEKATTYPYINAAGIGGGGGKGSSSSSRLSCRNPLFAGACPCAAAGAVDTGAP